MDTGATTSTTIPQMYYNNAGTPTHDAVSNHHHSSTPISSVIIIIIILSSIIIISAFVYFLIRFVSFRTTVSPVSEHQNENEDAHHHQVQVSIDSNDLNWLPVFTYSSITGNTHSVGDCAVCLTKFEAKDRLRRLPLCCHAFHVECIDPWLKSNHTCPLCRSTINPTEADIINKTGNNNNNNNSLRIEIGTISRRRDSSESESDRTSYSLGSYEYVIDGGYEIPVEMTHRRDVSGDKDEPIGGGGNRNWLRDYVDRLSSRTMSFGGSGRFFTGSSRRSEVVDDYEVAHGRIGEEISEYFRWLSGV